MNFWRKPWTSEFNIKMNSANDFAALTSLFVENDGTKLNSNSHRQYLPSQIQANKTIVKQVRKTDINDIWDEDEVDLQVDEDPRPQPEYSINYVQRVSSEDMYLGMSGKTPSFSQSDYIQVKIHLPNTELKEINLNITKDTLEVMCPN